MQSSTPIRKHSSSTAVYTSNHVSENAAAKQLAGIEMDDKFTEIPTSDFLDMLPDCPGMPTVDHEPFEKVANISLERNQYRPWVSSSVL